MSHSSSRWFGRLIAALVAGCSLAGGPAVAQEKTKLRVSVTLTITMGIGFYMMRRVPLGQIILGIVWVCHLLYFIYGIRTSK